MLVQDEIAVDNMIISDIVKHKYAGHAFIVTGKDMEERSRITRFAAHAVLCDGEQRPCGECYSCKLNQEDAHPDLIRLTAQGHHIKIQQIRELHHSAGLKPVKDRRVFIIEGAENMTIEAANALLKLLEDPPPGTFFFLTAGHEEGLLPTIVSRCLHINLGYQESKVLFDEWPCQELDDILVKEEIVGLFAMVNKLEKQREKAISFLNYLREYYRNLLQINLSKKPLDRMSLSKFMSILEQILVAQKRLENNGNIRLVLDNLMLYIAKETRKYCSQ